MAIFDSLVAHRAIEQPTVRYRGPVELGPSGPSVFDRLGIDLNEKAMKKLYMVSTATLTPDVPTSRRRVFEIA